MRAAQGKFDAAAKAITHVGLRTLAVRNGTGVTEPEADYHIGASSVDIDRLFGRALAYTLTTVAALVAFYGLLAIISLVIRQTVEANNPLVIALYLLALVLGFMPLRDLSARLLRAREEERRSRAARRCGHPAQRHQAGQQQAEKLHDTPLGPETARV